MEQKIAARDLIGPRSDVALMAGYYSPQLDVDVHLNANEAPSPPPREFVERLRDALLGLDLNRYPDREAVDLRRALARHHGLSPDHVYCANGSNEVLQSILLAYGGHARAAVVFEPTYALHSHIANLTQTSVVRGGRDRDFLIDVAEFDRLREAMSSELGPANPAITFVCSPNNPTGAFEPVATIVALLERSPGLVIVDEAYGQFAPRSMVELLDSFRNLVVVRTFSKTWSLAALRLGYALGDPEVIDALFRVTLPYHVDAIKQVAGVLALEYEPEMQQRIATLVAERLRIVEGLCRLSVEVVPSAANFVLFKVRGRSAQEVWKALVDRSILVRDISGVPFLEGYLRVTVGLATENDAFLESMGEILNSAQ